VQYLWATASLLSQVRYLSHLPSQPGSGRKNSRTPESKLVIIMSMTDPVSDFLTRIRNAAKAKHRRVDIPASELKKAMAQILVDQKYISDFAVLEDGKQGLLRLNLKYQNGRPVIRGLRRVSKPGIRQYRTVDKLPRVLGGLGVAIVSTSKGVMTDMDARKQKVGGEIIAFVW